VEEKEKEEEKGGGQGGRGIMLVGLAKNRRLDVLKEFLCKRSLQAHGSCPKETALWEDNNSMGGQQLQDLVSFAKRAL